jgi:prepilin-type N-terminal cleavage/methylation domain-containing protein
MEGTSVTSHRKEDPVRSRSGFTLIEALIVVVILGLIVLLGYPKVGAAMAKTDLRSARTTVINLVATARAASVQTNRRTWIKFEGNKAYVLARPRQKAGAGTADTVGTVQNLSAQYGVTLAAVADSIQFDPRGFGANLGDTSSVTLSRNGHAETVKLDGLGRVIK